MATMAEIMAGINNGLGALSTTPLGQFGTQMLAQSGPQQGNPSGGARLGQALAGMSDAQARQMLQQYRQAQIQQAEQQHAFQQQQAQLKAQQMQRQQQAFTNPALQSQLGPVARQLASLGVDPEMIMQANSNDALQADRSARLAQQQAHFVQQQANRGAGGGGGQPSGPKVPTPRQILEEPLPGNMIQKHLYDPATGSYKPYGKPYPAFAPGKADPMQDLLNEVTPDDNAGAGPAVPGLPGANASPTPPPQGAELLMIGAGSNPRAHKPAATKGPATPKTDAEFKALPSGTLFIDPDDGKIYRKP